MNWDVAIVGAGALGTFHAFHLAQMGKKVVIFEKDPQPREATVRNFGQVVPSGFPIGRWHHYGRYSTALYKELQSKRDIGIHPNGSLYIASDPSEMRVLEELHAKFADVDYASQLLTKLQVLDHSDRIKEDYAVGGLYFPQEVSADPRRMIKTIQDYLVEHFDVTIRYNTTVIDIFKEKDGAKLVLAGNEKVWVERAFICNGRDFNILFPALFREANIEVSKLQMLLSEPVDFQLKGNILTGMTIRRYESFKTCESYKELDPENAHPELAEKGIHVLFKQRADGSVIIGDSHVYADASKGYDTGFDEDERINRLILNEARNILNWPDLKIRYAWSGFYGQMKGEEEIFEKVIDDCIHIVTAIGGKGMTASAGYAKEHVEKIYNQVMA